MASSDIQPVSDVSTEVQDLKITIRTSLNLDRFNCPDFLMWWFYCRNMTEDFIMFRIRLRLQLFRDRKAEIASWHY